MKQVHIKRATALFLFCAGLACASIFVLHASDSGYEPPAINAGYPINTEGDDFCPSITEDGNIMVFSSRMPKQSNHDIYMSFFKDGRWTTPEPMSILNSEANDETPYITPDGSMILFSSDREGSIRPSITADGRERITFDLFQSKYINDKWTMPEPVPGDVNTLFNERSPSLSRDMKTLYFSRWPFRRIRDARIFRAVFRNDSYVMPEELPEPVNTCNAEIGFTPSRRLPGFYFSSRRPGGYGGWDIYFIPSDGNRFGIPVNLGRSINGPDDELFPAEGNGLLYFSSNRSGGLGRYDIYYRSIPSKAKESAEQTKSLIEKMKTAQPESNQGPAPDAVLPFSAETDKTPREKMSIYADGTDAPVPRAQPIPVQTGILLHIVTEEGEASRSLKVKLYLKDNPNPAKPEKRVVEEKTDEQGMVTIYPRSDVRWIVLKIKEPGFAPVRKSIRIVPGVMQNVKVQLSPTGKNTVKQGIPASKEKPMKSIHFSFNSAVIPLKYYPSLHVTLDYLRENPSIRIKITGHSDPWGPEKASDRISLQRAQAVRDYFERMGIPSERMVIDSAGSQKPLRYVNGKKHNWINRRVEFSTVNEITGKP